MSLSGEIAVAKAAGVKKKPHRFTKIVTNEVSLVDNPAILTEDEAEIGLGLPVVKLHDASVFVPADVQKAISLKGDEDYHEALRRLIATAKTRVIAETKDSDVYYWTAIKIFDDNLILGDLWSDPFSSAFKAYRCGYLQQADGDFEIDNVTVVRLRFVEEVEETDKSAALGSVLRADSSQKNDTVPAPSPALPGGAKVSKILKGMEIQGTVYPLEAATGPFVFNDPTGALIVKTNAKGEVAEVGKGYHLDDADIVRPVPAVIEATKVMDMMRLMEQAHHAGQSMTMDINPKTGEMTMKVLAMPTGLTPAAAAPAAPAASAAPAAMSQPEDATKAFRDLMAQHQALLQRLNGGSTPETQGAGATTYTTKNTGRQQTAGLPVDAPAFGLFTKCFAGQVKRNHIRPN